MLCTPTEPCNYLSKQDSAGHLLHLRVALKPAGRRDSLGLLLCFLCVWFLMFQRITDVSSHHGRIYYGCPGCCRLFDSIRLLDRYQPCSTSTQKLKIEHFNRRSHCYFCSVSVCLSLQDQLQERQVILFFLFMLSISLSHTVH